MNLLNVPEILLLNISYIPCKTSLRVCPLRIVNPLSALIIIMYSIDISIDKYLMHYLSREIV